MIPTEINDEKALQTWLNDKPHEWAQSIALRAALRALPYVAQSSKEWLNSFALLPFGALVTSWMQLVDVSTFVRTDESRADARFGGETFDFKLYRSSPIAALAADASYHSADAQSESEHSISDCVKGVIRAAGAFRYASVRHGVVGENGDCAAATLWNSVEIDCQFLIDHGDNGVVRALEIQPFWDFPTEAWDDDDLLPQLTRQLLSVDPNFSVWIDWYVRRISGEEAAFDISGDKYRVEDKAILRRLAEATNEDFWDKGHEYVNATLKGWLDEARERASANLAVTLPIGLVEETNTAFALTPAQIETLPQNRNALSFRADENGKIAIDVTALSDQLRDDADAQDRHAEAIAEAQIVFDRCQRSNAGARLTRLFENYLAAAGEAVDGVKPSLLVQRGERLRQELSAYQNPDSFLDPLADDLLLDMKGWQSAHNMMVGLDPVLNAMDVAILGPDKQPALISPDEIKEKAREAHEAELLQNGVLEIIEEAADLAPAIPDPADRHTIWSTEMVRNLMIETASIALNNPLKTGAIVAVCGGGGIVGGISIMGSIKAAEYLVNHRDWVLARLGNTPTWQALIAQLADWLEKVTPFKPK